MREDQFMYVRGGRYILLEIEAFNNIFQRFDWLTVHGMSAI